MALGHFFLAVPFGITSDGYALPNVATGDAHLKTIGSALSFAGVLGILVF